MTYLRACLSLSFRRLSNTVWSVGHARVPVTDKPFSVVVVVATLILTAAAAAAADPS